MKLAEMPKQYMGKNTDEIDKKSIGNPEGPGHSKGKNYRDDAKGERRGQ